MRLSEFAIACYIYSHISDYDTSYRRFLKATNNAPDLRIDEHRLELLKWLNMWGCWQFAKDHHGLASDEIRDWFEEARTWLFTADKTLLEISERQIESASAAYEKLAKRTASIRTNKSGGKFNVLVGPTGAAKILFAIRPKSLVPWDDPIRKRLGLDGSANSYVVYLGIVRAKLEELDEACERNGYNLSDLPELVNRPTSSLVKLVDESFWATMTRQWSAPTKETLARWATWD